MKTTKQLIKEENASLASYAMKSSQSLGRVHKEIEDSTRLPFQRDRDRVIHCKSFRRLQAKTQVFVSYFGDHYRDRLTHSIEVSQIARDISRSLGLNEDLSEVLSLAHDIGHPPFGHGGEDALNEVMQEFKLGFEHNEQSRRIIESLEKIYPSFDGLNVSKETLDGLLKHNPHNYHTYIDFVVSPHLEGQVMDLSDEIAYTNHDVDDGLRSGIFTVDQMSQFALWQKAKEQVMKKYKIQTLSIDKESDNRFHSRIISNMISQMIVDLCQQTEKNLKSNRIDSLDKVRKFKGKLVDFSPSMKKQKAELRSFLVESFYHNPKVAKQINRGKKILKSLFFYYLEHPRKLPQPFLTMQKNGERLEIVIKDYIAGMTDHFAEEQHSLLKL